MTTTEITTAIEQAQAVAGQADDETVALLAEAETFAITSDFQYEQSGEFLRRLKAKEGELSSIRLSITRPIDQAKARVLDLFRPAGDRLEKAERAIKGAMLTFSREQEQRRREQQAKLDEAARKETERLRALAEAQRERGEERRADVTMSRAETVPVVIVAPSTPKVGGIAMRVTWRAEVDDVLALARAVGAGEQPPHLITANMAALNTLARGAKEGLNIPGVRAVSEEGIAARAAAREESA